MPDPDFRATNHGSIITLQALTPEANEWVDENLPADFNGAIEPRYFEPIYEGILDGGLTFE